jgi:hypothetical protein
LLLLALLLLLWLLLPASLQAINRVTLLNGDGILVTLLLLLAPAAVVTCAGHEWR